MIALRCVTCRDLYEVEADIYSRLQEFDDHCICRNCVQLYRKTPNAQAGGSKDSHVPAGKGRT